MCKICVSVSACLCVSMCVYLRECERVSEWWVGERRSDADVVGKGAVDGDRSK